MKKNIKRIVAAALALCLLHSGIIFADQLILKDGQTLTGKMVSRTDTEVIFKIAGQPITFPLANIQDIKIDFNPAPQAQTSQQAPAVASQQPAPQAQVPAGTSLTISLKDALDTNRHASGHRFTAMLEGNLMAGNTVAAPRGATVYGRVVTAKKSGRLVGKAQMEITFTEVMINNKLIPIQTSNIAASAGRTSGKTARTTAKGAVIGGLIDGSSGAKTGAKVGLGASVLTRGNQVQIPAGTLFDVRLTAPLSI